MGIKDMLQRFSERSKRYKELEDNYNMQKKLEQLQMTSNERELNRFNEEYRQKLIKQRLDTYRKKEHNEIWHGKTMLETKNMFQNMPSIMKNNSMFKEDTNVLQQERLF